MLDLVVDRREMKATDRARAALHAARSRRTPAQRRRRSRRVSGQAAEPLVPSAARLASSRSNVRHQARPREHPTLCDALGHPERAFPSIHVAGTNGKGSVTAMVDTRAARGRAPRRPLHLAAPRSTRRALRHRRRAGRPATSRDAAARCPRRVESLLRAGDARRAADVLRGDDGDRVRAVPPGGVSRSRVIEVGLGGRFDATNVVDARRGTPSPRSASTTSSISATRSRRSPSRRPASSSRACRSSSAPLPPEAHGVIGGRCARTRRALIRAGDGASDVDARSTARAIARRATPARAYPVCRLALRGRHQVDNALVAVRLLEVLRRARASRCAATQSRAG